MTEQEWLECTDPPAMLAFMRGKASDRKLRLFACGCCRRIWDFIDEKGQQAVITAERSAHDKTKWLEDDLMFAVDYARYLQEQRLHLIPTYLAPEGRRNYAPEDVASQVLRVIAYALPGQSVDKELMGQAHFLRDIFGNPFRPVFIDPCWHTPTVLALAQAAYDNRQLPAGTLDRTRLAILADALEDAGTSQEILNHFRQGDHYRGCWPLDLILGKD